MNKNEIAPKGMEFKPTEFRIGGKYSTIITIVNFPKNIYVGYLSDITNISGVKVVVKHIPIQFSVLQKMINKEIGDLKAQRREILQEAFKLYQLECYAGCIPVIYAQLEGLLTDVLSAQGYLKQSQTKFVDVYKIVPGLKGHEIKSLWHKAKIATELNRYFAELAPYKMDSSSTVTMSRHNMLHGTDVANFNQERSSILFIWLFAAISFMSTIRA